MSWLSSIASGFASGVVGAALNTSSSSDVKKTETDTPKEVKEAAVKSNECAKAIKAKWGGGFAPTLEVDVFVPDPREGPQAGSGTQIG
jgi:hypothetical protein